MPAVISAIFSAIYAALAKKDDYKGTLDEIFPAMTDPQQIEAMNALSGTNATELFLGGYGRTASQQGGYQLFGIALTVAVAIVGGLITVYKGIFLYRNTPVTGDMNPKYEAKVSDPYQNVIIVHYCRKQKRALPTKQKRALPTIGLLLKTSCIRNLDKEEQHEDDQYWEVPEEKEC
uniref:Ammonium transporter AmtB-like domain-containing protein n=1 Tax=Megaselia scalaris TaxID=36166 RepID=T1GA00_MEGSC